MENLDPALAKLYSRGWQSDAAREKWWVPGQEEWIYPVGRALELDYPPPPIPSWLRGTLPSPDYQVQFLKRDGSVHWKSNVGPQTWGLLCPFDEILAGGRRGGSKTSLLIAWFAMGDLSLPEDDPARYSFLNEPSFRGLVLREEYQSLADFVDEMAEFFRPFGCKVKDDPAVFEFPGGAKIFTNHLGTKEAYEKYKGQGITKIGIEEAVQIPEARRYIKLFGSLRGKKQVRIHNKKVYPALHCQVMLTTNPDGPGALWVKDRFVRVDSEQGPIPWNTPMRDPISGLVRIFIPMKREDNPYLRDNKQYEGQLLAQDEVTRRQWMDGDWDAQSGTFFTTYRPNGPLGAEEEAKYPWARHMIAEPVNLRPWWFRWGSVDIGYDHPSAAHKACRNSEDKRIHIYDEMTVRRCDSYEFGVLLAKWWLPELEQLPDHQITLYVSPDAFSKTDATKTRAEQMESGIKEVLGPYGALMLRFNDLERQALAQGTADRARKMFDQRRADFQGKMGIVLAPANDSRKDGCDYINGLLRFRPVLTETQDELKERLMQTFDRIGVEAYERELARARTLGPEILPRLQIWPACKELDRCLKEAVRGEPPKNEEYAKWDAVDGAGGDDSIDSARYLLMGFKEVEPTIPKQYFVGERMAQAQERHIEAFGAELTDPTRLAMIAMRQNANYEKLHPANGGSVNIPRAGSMRHRRPN